MAIWSALVPSNRALSYLVRYGVVMRSALDLPSDHSASGRASMASPSASSSTSSPSKSSPP